MTKLSDKRYSELFEKEILSTENLTPSEAKEYYDHYRTIRDEAIDYEGHIVFKCNDIVGTGGWNGKKCHYCNSYTHIRLWNRR